MLNHQEGVSQFKLKLNFANHPNCEEILALERWRAILYRINLVGEYPINKVGFGNLSSRSSGNSFYITGSQTGSLQHLKKEHYCHVISCDIDKYKVEASGMIPPSSETMTHFSLYSAHSEINCVFHIHHPQIWKMLIEQNAFVTPASINYGSKELTTWISENISLDKQGKIVMKGHQDGLIYFGPNPQQVGQKVLEDYRKIRLVLS